MNWARSISTLTVVGLLVQSSLCSWGHSTVSNTPSTYIKNNYPLSQDQEWYTEESYLLLKPSMENMWYGNKATVEINGASVTNTVKVKDPEYDWNSGVRLALGKYLPHHDGWDMTLTSTYVYSDARNETNGSPYNGGAGFNSSYSFTNVGQANQGKVVWRLNYWTVDLTGGRLFQMTPKVVFHPYLGLRGSWQYQTTHSTTFSLSPAAGEGLEETLTTFSSNIKNDFWGVGPRFGTNLTFYFGSRFSFLANLSASLLVGNQKLSNNNVVNTTAGPLTTPGKSHDRLSVIRTNLEGMVGLGWETWLKNDTVRIAPSVGLEGSLWFAMNQLYNIYPVSNTFDNVEQRRTGNLGLMGVSFNLQVDF